MIGELRGRTAGTIVACAMSLYAIGPLPLIDANGQSCCCHEHSPDCRCPTCTHARELASGSPMVTTCAPQPAMALPVARAVLSLAAIVQLPSPPLPLPIDLAPRSPPPGPVPDVPTPPPLAHA
jgi:hypothetical protein